MISNREWRAAMAMTWGLAWLLTAAGVPSPAQAEPARKKVPVQVQQKADDAPPERPRSRPKTTEVEEAPARPANGKLAPTAATAGTAPSATADTEAPPKPSGRGKLSSKLGPPADAAPAPVTAGATATTTAAPFPCPTPPDARDGAFELGLNYGAMFPSGLVGADKTLPTLGLVIGAPIGVHTLQAQIDYGSAINVRVLILELNMRWSFDSPYLASYFITGGHYLKQESDTVTAVDRGAFGLTAGIGLSFALGRQLEAHFDLRGYIQNRTTILVSGGFSVLM